jgi:hypothetical protein
MPRGLTRLDNESPLREVGSGMTILFEVFQGDPRSRLWFFQFRSLLAAGGMTLNVSLTEVVSLNRLLKNSVHQAKYASVQRL